MKTVTLYILETGQIVGSLTASSPLVTAGNSKWGEIDGLFDGASHYVDITQAPPIAAERHALAIAVDKLAIVAGGADAAHFTGIPASVSVAVDGGPVQAVTDGTLDFGAQQAGTYTVVFSGVAWIPQTFQVAAS